MKKINAIIAFALAGIMTAAGCSSDVSRAETSASGTTAATTVAVPETTSEPTSAENTSVSSSARADADSSEPEANAYSVLVTDPDGKPVEGVTVQFCSDEECQLVVTDTGGIAAFEFPEGKYEVHILKVPEGYAKDRTAYETEEKYGTLTIVLGHEDSAGLSGE